MIHVFMLFFAGIAPLEVLLPILLSFYVSIGLIEGFATVSVVSFMSRVKPELLRYQHS